MLRVRASSSSLASSSSSLSSSHPVFRFLGAAMLRRFGFSGLSSSSLSSLSSRMRRFIAKNTVCQQWHFSWVV